MTPNDELRFRLPLRSILCMLLGLSMLGLQAQESEFVLPIQVYGLVGSVRSVVYSPEGSRILVGGSDAAVVDAESGEILHRLLGHTEGLWCVGFSPDGGLIVTGSDHGIVRLWDPVTGEELRRFTLPPRVEGQNAVLSIAFSPDSTQVLSGSIDGTARLWDAVNATEILAFVGHTARVRSVAFSPDGAQVLTGSFDETARLWDAATGAELRRFEGHLDTVTFVAKKKRIPRIVIDFTCLP